MAPKKRDRERPGSVNENNAEDKKKIEEKAEVERRELLTEVPKMFLRSTQLYRMWALRHATMPLFLHRSLTYLRQRSSRNHVRRKTFKVDSILATKKENEPERPTKYLTITYLGYYDGTLPSSECSTVRVETSIMKRAHNRRKDSSVPVVKLCMGTSEVPVNPRDDDDRPVPIISIAPETINVTSSQVKARSLMIRLIREAGSNKEPFEVSYQVFNSRGQCILGDAYYDAGPGVQHGLWLRLQGAAKEAIEDSSVKSPKISFKLEWTKDAKSGWVQRPRRGEVSAAPIASVPESLGDNKENRPAKRSIPPPSRPSRTTRATTGPTALAPSETEDTTNPTAVVPKTANSITISYNFQYHTGHLNTPFDGPFNCPWCDLNCMKLYSLFKHLKICHDRYTFSFTMTDKHVQIDVSLNEMADKSYEGNPYDLVSPKEATDFVSRRTVFTKVLVCHPKRVKPNIGEFLEAEEGCDGEAQRPLITGHDRLYYHSTTCLPIHPREMDQDSEGERDPKWLQQKTIMMIDDFTDVNEGEKEVIKMWNLHVLKNGYVGECQLPLGNIMIVKEKWKEILKKNLYRNFTLHHACLFDFGLLSSAQIHKITRLLRGDIRISPEAQHTIRETWLEERRQWLESGGDNGPRNKAAQDFPLYGNQPGPSTSSTFITGDGTLRRKMVQQTPQGKKNKSAAAGSSRQLAVEEDDDELEEAEPEHEPANTSNSERALRKRKLSLQDRPGEEPAKRARCGSDPLETGKAGQPLRRKSAPPSDVAKPPLRKSVAP